jgi:putative sterol carrier protein
MTENNLQALMDRVVNSFQPEKAAGVDATLQFHITGDQGGDWGVAIKNKQLSVTPGVVQNPKLSITANSQDILNMFSGKLNPMQAYMQGKVQAKGDLGLAMKLAELFKL